MTRGIVILRCASMSLLSMTVVACAPVGAHYGSWSDGPVAAFTVTPSDDCQRPEIERSIVNSLNSKIGRLGGPSAQVTSAAGLVTTPNGAIDGPSLTCRGKMQTAGGMVGPGTVQIRLADDSTSKAFAVKDASWEADINRDRREAAMRKEQERRIAEAPAREAKMMEDMRSSAQAEPNKMVHCGIGRSQLWTTNAVCFALIAEAKYLSSKIGKESRDEMLYECGKDISLKLPGKDQPTYMNVCESLIDTYFN